MKEEFEDTKGVIRIHKSKKDRQHSGQKEKKTNNDLQDITHTTKDRVTRTPIKTGGELMCSGRVFEVTNLTYYNSRAYFVSEKSNVYDGI